MSEVEERTVKKSEAYELFVQIETSLRENDALVQIDGQIWRVVDFAPGDYAVLVLQAE